MICSCKKELEPFLAEMQKAAKKTIQTELETGFTVGKKPEGEYKIEHVDTDHAIGLQIKRPTPPYKPYLHFHTHVKGDVVKGLSGGDTNYPFFKDGIYPFHCVATTSYNKIYCFRPDEVISHPDFQDKLNEHIQLSFDHAKLLLFKYPHHRSNIIPMLEKNKLTDVIKYERKHCPELEPVMRKMMLNWNDFIQKTKCAEFSIQ